MTGCPSGPHLHVVAERSLWRWSYHEPASDDGEDLHLQSSIGFTDADEARSSATVAHPGLPVAEDEPGVGRSEPAPGSGHRCRRIVPAALAATVLLVTAMIILRRSGPGGDLGADEPGPSAFRRASPGYRRQHAEVRGAAG